MLITAVLLVLGFTIAHSTDFDYPKIARSMTAPAMFAPEGWMIKSSAEGDLNKDMHLDYALVLESTTPIVVEDAVDQEDPPTFNPRILIIVFYNPTTKRYELVEQSNTFIMVHDNPNAEEPFAGIEIKNGVLDISFTIFMNSGSWYTTNGTYRFRYQDGQMTLIGADKSEFNRGTSEYTNYSINFSTKKMEVVSGVDAEQKETKRTKKLKIDRLRTLKTMERPFEWEVDTDVYI